MRIEAKIDRLIPAGKLKAIASVSLDGMFVVKNLKVMDGRKGLFVAMPQEVYSGKDGQKQYSNVFFALTNSGKTQLQDVVLDAYKLSLDPSYVPRHDKIQNDCPQHIQHQRDYYGGQYQNQYTESQYPDWMKECDDEMTPMDMGGM